MIANPGTGDILFPQVRKRFLKFLAPFGVGARHPLPCRSGLPNAQEPDPVKAPLRQAIQFGIGNVIQSRRPAQLPGEFRQPDTGIDLI